MTFRIDLFYTPNNEDIHICFSTFNAVIIPTRITCIKIKKKKIIFIFYLVELNGNSATIPVSQGIALVCEKNSK